VRGKRGRMVSGKERMKEKKIEGEEEGERQPTICVWYVADGGR